MTSFAGLIADLGRMIGKDVKQLEDGKGRWWQRVGSATRKEEVAEYMVGVERAKTLVMDTKIKITLYVEYLFSFCHVAVMILIGG